MNCGINFFWPSVARNFAHVRRNGAFLLLCWPETIVRVSSQIVQRFVSKMEILRLPERSEKCAINVSLPSFKVRWKCKWTLGVNLTTCVSLKFENKSITKSQVTLKQGSKKLRDRKTFLRSVLTFSKVNKRFKQNRRACINERFILKMGQVLLINCLQIKRTY